MAYVSLREWKNGDITRKPGDLVPEAMAWRNVDPWLNQKWIREVPEHEVKNGRWVRLDEYRNGLGLVAAKPSSSQPTAEPVSEPEPKAEAPSTDSPSEKRKKTMLRNQQREALEAQTKAELLDIAAGLGVEAGKLWRKASVVDAILNSGKLEE